MNFQNIFRLYSIFLIFYLVSCTENKTENLKSISKTNQKRNNQNFEKYPAQYELQDSLKLKHIKNEFYRNEYGFLYEKTVSQREIKGHLKDVEYFNGVISQEIDPNSFYEIENSWFAKDNKNVYYIRPTSGGMQITKIENADPKTFKVLDGNYKYAADKNNFFSETETIENYEPLKTDQIKDGNGKVVKLKMEKFEIILEP